MKQRHRSGEALSRDNDTAFGGRPSLPIRKKGRKVGKKKERKNAPQALHILFPTSSLLHSGVVLVPQFAQFKAPTTATLPLPTPAPPPTFPPPSFPSPSSLGEDSALVVAG